MCSRFCTPWNLGAALMVYLAGVEEANFVSCTCIVVGDVMSRGHGSSGRPGATIQDGREVRLDVSGLGFSWIQCYRTWLERKSGWSRWWDTWVWVALPCRMQVVASLSQLLSRLVWS